MKVFEKTGCKCVYCRGTKDDLSNYAAELELLAYHLLGDLKEHGAHNAETCGFKFKSGRPKTLAHRVGMADGCNCGFDAAVKSAMDDFQRLHFLASKRHGRKLRRRKS